jgi:hypothetical protein
MSCVSPSLSPPEFFIDRNLGRRRVAEALRERGWRVRTHHEVFGDRDEDVADVEWLEYCGRAELPVITKDRKLRYRPEEMAAIRRHGVKAFVLTRGSLRAGEQVHRFEMSRSRIVAACVDPGPFMYAVHADRIVRIFPS